MSQAMWHWAGRATGIRASSHSSLGLVLVQSATFAGRRGWVGLRSLGQSGLGKGIGIATALRFSA